MMLLTRLRLLKFREEFIKNGIEGGRHAAKELRKSVASICVYPNETETMVKVIANMSLLNKLLRTNGVVDTDNDLREFAIGFNQSIAAFDFMDIGYSMERSLSKIKGASILNKNLK